MQQLPTDFAVYSFTEQEEIAARTFSPLQRAFLQSEFTSKAQTRLALIFDPSNPYAVMQEEAYLKGQMELLAALLASPEAEPEAV